MTPGAIAIASGVAEFEAAVGGSSSYRVEAKPQVISVSPDADGSHLTALQQTLGGRVACVPLRDGIQLYCNRGGLLFGLPLARRALAMSLPVPSRFEVKLRFENSELDLGDRPARAQKHASTTSIHSNDSAEVPISIHDGGSRVNVNVPNRRTSARLISASGSPMLSGLPDERAKEHRAAGEIEAPNESHYVNPSTHTYVTSSSGVLNLGTATALLRAPSAV